MSSQSAPPSIASWRRRRSTVPTSIPQRRPRSARRAHVLRAIHWSPRTVFQPKNAGRARRRAVPPAMIGYARTLMLKGVWRRRRDDGGVDAALLEPAAPAASRSTACCKLNRGGNCSPRPSVPASPLRAHNNLRDCLVLHSLGGCNLIKRPGGGPAGPPTVAMRPGSVFVLTRLCSPMNGPRRILMEEL